MSEVILEYLVLVEKLFDCSCMYEFSKRIVELNLVLNVNLLSLELVS